MYTGTTACRPYKNILRAGIEPVTQRSRESLSHSPKRVVNSAEIDLCAVIIA